MVSGGPAPATRGSGFAEAFTEAVAASGMSLDAIRTALAERGHQLSVATLSYWRSGRRRPERSSSLAALGELEDMLGVPPGSLLGRLPGRGTPTSYDVAELYELNGTNRALATLVERLGLNYDDGLERLSIQDLVELDERGRQVRNRVRMVIRCLRAGTDRFPMSFGLDLAEERGTPTVRPLLGCSVGRTIVSPDDRVLMAEAILDHPLEEGETSLVEFELTAAGRSETASRWERGLLRPLSLYLVSVSFHPTRMPTSVERFERPIRLDHVKSSPVLVTSPCVTVLFTDLAPGVAGVAWRW